MQLNEINERISAIEDGMNLFNGKIDSLGKDLAELANQNRVILQWILERFGAQLSRDSSLSSTTTPDTNTNNNIAIDQSCSFTAVSTEVTFNGISTPSNPLDHLSSIIPGCSIMNQLDIDMNSRTSVQPTKLGDISSLNLEEETATSDSGVATVPKVPKRGRPCKQISENNCKQVQPSSQCEQCGKLVQVGSLRQHKLTHKVPKYPCSECGKSFRRRFHLKTHLLIHSGDKKHQCGFCGILFLLPKDLVAHERTHTGERPFSCDQCSKAFTLKSHLTMHIRTHTGEKPYICDICKKSFSQSNSLRIHKKIHIRLKQMSSTPQVAADDFPHEQVQFINIQDENPISLMNPSLEFLE